PGDQRVIEVAGGQNEKIRQGFKRRRFAGGAGIDLVDHQLAGGGVLTDVDATDEGAGRLGGPAREVADLRGQGTHRQATASTDVGDPFARRGVAVHGEHRLVVDGVNADIAAGVL